MSSTYMVNRWVAAEAPRGGKAWEFAAADSHVINPGRLRVWRRRALGGTRATMAPASQDRLERMRAALRKFLELIDAKAT